jgi:hypothetical protein
MLDYGSNLGRQLVLSGFPPNRSQNFHHGRVSMLLLWRWLAPVKAKEPFEEQYSDSKSFGCIGFEYGSLPWFAKTIARWPAIDMSRESGIRVMKRFSVEASIFQAGEPLKRDR